MLDLFIFTILSPLKTGLPFVVWISPRGNARHDLRVNVSHSPKATPGEFVTVAVRPQIRVIRGALPAPDFLLLKQWIELNEKTLIAFWDGDIAYTEDVLKKLQRLG